MTGKQALDLANGILKSIQQDPISVPPLNGTEKENVEAVLRAYIVRLRKNQPRFNDVEEWMLPDMVVQRLREELVGRHCASLRCHPAGGPSRLRLDSRHDRRIFRQGRIRLRRNLHD